MQASVRRALLRPSAARRLVATSSKATPAKSAPLAVAADANDVFAIDHDMSATLSHGELAWCEVYGVDYEKLLKEAQDEAPLALNAPLPAHTAAPTATPQQDIWSVVFGTKN